jgi:hypothetical protein
VHPQLFIDGEESLRHSPQTAVNNCAPPKNFTVNNSTFARRIKANTSGPEDEYRFLNVRRFTGEFRSGPGALMQRNSQSLSPARQARQRRTFYKDFHPSRPACSKTMNIKL